MRARFLFAAALLISVQASAQGWPEPRGPFSWADCVMNSTTVSRSGGVYQLRQKTQQLFTPALEIPQLSFSDGASVSLNPDFFSYALGSRLYEDVAVLLFADGLFAPSDTLSYLRGLACYDIHDFSRAAASFAEVPSGSPWYSLSQEFINVYNSTPELPGYKDRSTFLAAALSAVIPGSGKIYAGDLRSGVSTFLIVGALGGMVAESWIKLGLGDWRTITLSSVFGLFYIGNIYGSAVSVSVIKDSLQDAEKAGLLFNLRVPLHQR